MMRHVPYTGSEIPTIETASTQLRKEGYGISACPYPQNFITPTLKAETDTCLYLAKGSVEIASDGKTCKLKPGDKLYLTKDDKYVVRVLSAEGSYHFIGKK